MAEDTRQPASRKKRKTKPTQAPVDYDSAAIERAIALLDAVAAPGDFDGSLTEAVAAAGRLGSPEPARALLAALRGAQQRLSDAGFHLLHEREDPGLS